MKNQPANQPALPFFEALEQNGGQSATAETISVDSFFDPQIPEPIDNDTRLFLTFVTPRYEHVGSLPYAQHNRRRASTGYSILRGESRRPRVVDVPNRELRDFQQWLCRDVLRQHTDCISDIACGIKGRQLGDMITPHLGHRYLFKLDISGAYQSVDLERLAQILSTTDSIPVVQWQAVLERFCAGETGLATGAVTSPLLFNIYMAPLDDSLIKTAAESGMTVTRYMDDVVFSSDVPIGKRRARTIKRQLYDYGFELNHHKVRYHDLQTDGPFMVTGLQLNPSGSWQLPRMYARHIHAFIKDTQRYIDENGALDLETMGVVRGLHGHLLACTKQSRERTPLEQAMFAAYHELESTYRSIYVDS